MIDVFFIKIFIFMLGYFLENNVRKFGKIYFLIVKFVLIFKWLVIVFEIWFILW